MAKLASRMDKPNGMTIICPDEVQDVLMDLPVEKLHGIGEKTKKHLNYLGITKAGELGNASLSILTAHFGLCGYMLRLMGKGIDNSPVPYYWQQDEIKSISHSYTLPFDTANIGLIKAYILMLCQRVAARLHKERKAAKTVMLVIRYNDFETFSHRKTAGYFVDTIHGIYHICLKILQEIGELAKPVRLLGVGVTGLAEESKQLYLLEMIARERELNKAIGSINSIFGEFTIKPASIMFAERFELLHGNEGWMPAKVNNPLLPCDAKPSSFWKKLEQI